MAMGLTRNQSRALAFIRDYSNGDGVPPTYREIATALGLEGSASRVHAILTALRDRGYIEWMPRRARSIRLLPQMEGLDDMAPLELRSLIARLAGLAAYKDGDGGTLMALSLRNIADRLAYQPRKVAA